MELFVQKNFKKIGIKPIVLVLISTLTLCSCGQLQTKSDVTVTVEDHIFTQSDASEDSFELPDNDRANLESITESPESKASTAEVVPEDNSYDFTLCFAGDMNLDDTWCTVVHMNRQTNGILDCISPELVKYMQDADVMCLNNEFTFSTGGTPLAGKAYCFQANPDKVHIWNTLGVDVVSLANNHASDFGPESLTQTIDTLKNAGIRYVGAGGNLEEAMKPVYIEVDGKTIAIVAGSRAEKNLKTPQATINEPGILHCYDTALLKEAIAEGKANSDYCILFVHWGTEYSTKLEEAQTESSREYLDAGADVIIGAHSHCLQGMEYVNGKPVIYSLGNYWFNEKTMDTMLINLHFYGNADEEHLEVQVIPALQKNCVTHYINEPAEQRAMYDRLENISINIEISDNGLVSQKVITEEE